MPEGRVGRFLDACRCQPVDTTPVWFMRQAGRSLPEYRALRGDGDILAAIANPELAAELTLQPVRRYGVDAAILFSDIVVPLVAIGVGIEIVAGRGPVIGEPFRTEADLERLRPLDAGSDAPYVAETVRILTKELAVPLIGFAGMPFTLASYLVEGGPSRSFARVKGLMHAEPTLFRALLDALASITVEFVRAQVDAGADAVQLFDSWAGALSRHDYEHFVMPASQSVLAALSGSGVPRVHFGVGTGELLDLMAGPEVEVVGVDWRVPLPRAAERIGPGKALQGNLDPAICLAPWEVVRGEVERVLDEAAGLDGHVFNLGHGVLPETDPAILERVVEAVHEKGAR
jgi:uroporphyrinogen decarboxylase